MLNSEAHHWERMTGHAEVIPINPTALLLRLADRWEVKPFVVNSTFLP